MGSLRDVRELVLNQISRQIWHYTTLERHAMFNLLSLKLTGLYPFYHQYMYTSSAKSHAEAVRNIRFQMRTLRHFRSHAFTSMRMTSPLRRVSSIEPLLHPGVECHLRLLKESGLGRLILLRDKILGVS